MPFSQSEMPHKSCIIETYESILCPLNSWWSLSCLYATRSDTVLVFHGIYHNPVHIGTLQPVWSYIKLYCFPFFVNPAHLSGSCGQLAPSTKGLSTTLPHKWHQGEHAGTVGAASAGHGGAAEGVGRNHHFCSPSEDFKIPVWGASAAGVAKRCHSTSLVVAEVSGLWDKFWNVYECLWGTF